MKRLALADEVAITKETEKPKALEDSKKYPVGWRFICCKHIVLDGIIGLLLGWILKDGEWGSNIRQFIWAAIFPVYITNYCLATNKMVL